MSVKKEEIKEQTEEVNVQVEEDPEELLDIIIPMTREHKEDVFIRVNERTWQVQRGKQVKLPRCAVKVVQQAEQALADMLAFEEKYAKG